MLALKLMFMPFRWSNNRSLEYLSTEIKSMYGVNGVVGFDSARTALYILLKSLGIGPGDDVLTPAFSCHVIANSSLWNGAKPVLVDVDFKTYNFDLEDLKKKITDRVRAVIIQHTFGIRQNVEEIRKICGKDVIIIEDLAHTFGFPDKNNQLKIEGDYAIATFGIEKGFSGVRGGVAIFKEKDEAYNRVSSFKVKNFPKSKTLVSLFNPVFWAFTNKIYYFGYGNLVIGKLITLIARKIGILGHIIEKPEYQCDMPSWMPAKLSPALAELALHQLKKRDRTNKHREEITKMWSDKFGKVSEDRILLRYPLRLTKDRAKFISDYKNRGILLGDWYRSILHVPKDTLDLIGYVGDCKKAEQLSNEIVNLPTSIGVGFDDVK